MHATHRKAVGHVVIIYIDPLSKLRDMGIDAGHATKSHFPIFQSRFALVEGIPLCIVQPFRQTKSTHSYDSFMSIYMQLKTWQNQRFKVSFVKYNMKK